ncbi:hypothetical protein BDM02DRAFT_3265871 [Thelephora ganbajun]|uniref:Uncharacterized protein n=1 Tax=Thelephora ganbajun TaxID=370292 RepID=A0ACB6ZST3_THEGA|nr:hypothetical protein BDM02DRAFT_3265871 [Thelephora ganbajun]
MERTPPISPLFLRLRAWAFGIISLLSFTWITLLCVLAYTRFTLSSRPEKTFIVVLLLINLVTVILLPVMLLLRFRPWLDVARMLTLLTCHIGVAATYVVWVPNMQCSSSNVDEKGICELVNAYMLIGAWFIPALLIVYCCCLALMVYRRRRRLAAEALEPKQTTGSPSLVPDSQTLTATAESNMPQKPNLSIAVPSRSHLSHISPSLAPSTPSVYSTQASVYGGVAETPKSTRSEKACSSRLSKPVPNWAFAY